MDMTAAYPFAAASCKCFYKSVLMRHHQEEGRDLCLTFETDEQKLRGAITFEKEMPSSAYSSFQTAQPLNLNSKSSHYLCFQKKCLI